jgi:hypothetical protein
MTRRRFASRAAAGLHNSAARNSTGAPTVNVSTIGGTTVVLGGAGGQGVYTASAGVVVGSLVELESADTVRRARPDEEDPKQVIGFCVEKSGNTCTVQFTGEAVLPGQVLTEGAVYFARSLGAISTTPPQTGALYVVGRAKNSSTIIITIAEPIHLS